MTHKQAFLAMTLFMDRFWEARKADFDDDLPSLLGVMMLRDDGFPIDKALWNPDWTECLPSPENLTPEQGFEAMKCFWEKYLTMSESDTRDISRLLQTVEASRAIFWQQWVEAVNEVSS